MKRVFVILAANLLLLSGCARHYVITLNNGSQIATRSKPHLKNGAYVYKDGLGNDAAMPAGRVAEISPAWSTPSKAEPFKPETMH